MSSQNTYDIEDMYMAPFFEKQKISIDRGDGAFAMSERVTIQLELGDHGGTYCGNPLGCAVAYAVINYLTEEGISENVEKMGRFALARLRKLKRKYSDIVVDVRGKGLRIFPPLNIRKEEIEEGLAVIEESVRKSI